MRRFLFIFCCMGVVGFLSFSEGATTLGYKTNNPGNPRLLTQDAEKTKANRGKLLESYLKDNKITCQDLWDEKQKGRDVISGTFDYDLPAVKAYCSTRMKWVQIDSSGHQWDKRNWKKVFVKELITKQPGAQQESLGQPVFGSSAPRVSSQRVTPLPSPTGEASRSAPPFSAHEDENDNGIDEEKSDEFTSMQRSVRREVVPRSSYSFKPIKWNGPVREVGEAQATVEDVYEKTRAHIEEMHAKWKKLETDSCRRNSSCLRRLKTSRAALEKHIRNLEKYVDSLERHNDFLLESLNQHLAENISRLSPQKAEEFRSYLGNLEDQNRDLAERIKDLRRETEALIDSLEGRASYEETEEIYEEASRRKKKTKGSSGSQGPQSPQGPLKVKRVLDSLKKEVATYQREGQALWAEIPRVTGHACAGTECDQVKGALAHAVAYEKDIAILKEQIATLQARVADVGTPNGSAKENAEKQIATLLTRVTEIEGQNARSETALKEALEQAHGSVATATKKAEDLVAEQAALVADVAAATKTEDSLRKEIKEISRQALLKHTGAHVEKVKRNEIEQKLKENTKLVASLRQKNYDLEQVMKKKLLAGKFVSTVQRARVKKAQEDNKVLTDKLGALGKENADELKKVTAELEQAEALKTVQKEKIEALEKQIVAQFGAQQKELEKALSRIKELEAQESQNKDHSVQDKEARIAELEAQKRDLLVRNIAQRWQQMAQQALVQKRLGTIKTAVGASESSENLADELQEATSSAVRTFSESVRSDTEAVLKAVQSTGERLAQSLKKEKELQERTAAAEDLVARQQEALTKTSENRNAVLAKQQKLEEEIINLKETLNGIGQKSQTEKEEVGRMKQRLAEMEEDLSKVTQEKQEEEGKKEKAQRELSHAIYARDLLEQQSKEALAAAAGLINQSKNEISEKGKALRSLQETVTNLRQQLDNYKKDDAEYEKQGQRVGEMRSQLQRQTAELEAAKKSLEKAQQELEAQSRQLQDQNKKHEMLAAETERLEKERQERERTNQEKWADAEKKRAQLALDFAERKKEFEANQQKIPDISQKMAGVSEQKRKKIEELLAQKKLERKQIVNPSH
jgi:hypothetical protein